MSEITGEFPTYASVDFLIILHFQKVHVINHQRLPHREFTLGQCGQHPLMLSEPEENYKTFYETKLLFLKKCACVL